MKAFSINTLINSFQKTNQRAFLRRNTTFKTLVTFSSLLAFLVFCHHGSSLAFVDPLAYRCPVPNQISVNMQKTSISCDAPPCGLSYSVLTPNQEAIQYGGGSGSFQCQPDGNCLGRSIVVEFMPSRAQCKECDPYVIKKTEISFTIINKYGETPLVDQYKRFPLTITDPMQTTSPICQKRDNQ